MTWWSCGVGDISFLRSTRRDTRGWGVRSGQSRGSNPCVSSTEDGCRFVKVTVTETQRDSHRGSSFFFRETGTSSRQGRRESDFFFVSRTPEMSKGCVVSVVDLSTGERGLTLGSWWSKSSSPRLSTRSSHRRGLGTTGQDHRHRDTKRLHL